MQLYDENRRKIEERIKEKFPGIVMTADETNHAGYVLWMLGEVPNFTNQGKIDRWMGCIQGIVHTLGLFTWDELREMTRDDLGV